MPPVLVKICGLSTPDTLEAALAAGADMVGFMSFARSPRHVTPDVMRVLRAQIGGRAQVVAVTVDPDDAALDVIAEALRPDLWQLHGRESPERVATIRMRFGLPVMKALGVATTGDLALAGAYAGAADRLLFDAKPPPGGALPGGNGLVFDWRLLADFDGSTPWMLSGGLNAANVASAIALTHAKGVDVSSGVESSPGVKDVAKIAAFVAASRAAGPAGLGSPDGSA